MRKIFTLVFLVTALSASAQVTIGPGVRGGFSNSNVTNSQESPRNNFYLGATLNMRLAKWYALQPELNYSRQGFRNEYDVFNDFDPNVSGSTRTETVALDYFGLTLDNQFYIYRGLHIDFAPYLDFLVNDENVRTRNDVDTGANFGIGYAFKNGIGVEARYKFGAIDLFYDYGDSDSDTDDINYINYAVQVGVTYTFQFKKKS